MVADFLRDPQANPLPDPPIQGLTMPTTPTTPPSGDFEPMDDEHGLWKSDYVDAGTIQPAVPPAPAPAPTAPSEDSEQ